MHKNDILGLLNINSDLDEDEDSSSSFLGPGYCFNNYEILSRFAVKAKEAKLCLECVCKALENKLHFSYRSPLGFPGDEAGFIFYTQEDAKVLFEAKNRRGKTVSNESGFSRKIFGWPRICERQHFGNHELEYRQALYRDTANGSGHHE